MYVQRLAKEKNEAVQADALVLSADTIVAYNGSVMANRPTRARRQEMLADLRGKDHRVYTAPICAIMDRRWRTAARQVLACGLIRKQR